MTTDCTCCALTRRVVAEEIAADFDRRVTTDPGGDWDWDASLAAAARAQRWRDAARIAREHATKPAESAVEPRSGPVGSRGHQPIEREA